MSSIVIVHIYETSTSASYTYPTYFKDLEAAEIAITQMANHRAQTSGGTFEGFVPAEEAFVVSVGDEKVLYSTQVLMRFEDTMAADSIW